MIKLGKFLVICFDRNYYHLISFLQVLFVTNREARKIKLQEFERMLKVLFEKEGIDPRLIEVTMSYLTFVCEISVKDAEALRRMVAIPAKKNWLRQIGIHSIELEHGSEFESILVSQLDGIGI